jgi:hypothetical protein
MWCFFAIRHIFYTILSHIYNILYTYMYMYVCMYVFMYEHTYVCMHVYETDFTSRSCVPPSLVDLICS